jgi:cyclopropane-fatty-acyl-phospholipid synthase
MKLENQTEGRGTGVHYDTPPEVFELLLDKNMNYACGYYLRGDEDLDTAQVEKMNRIARHLGLAEGHRILDMGCGWSGPALYFAEQFGCHVTGITLSPVQQEYGLKWAARRGLTERIQIEVRNVMEVSYPPESFDHIIFLESIIHMSQKDALFALCHTLLKPDGKIFIQESDYDRGSMRARYLSDPGFKEVDRAFGYISHMVSGGEMLCHLEEAKFIPEYLENISSHYTRTLSQWLDRLDTHADRMRSISERAYWMLRRYLMIALGTYRSGHTVCHQIMARKVLY